MKCFLQISMVFFIGIASLNAQSKYYKSRKGFRVAVKNNVLSYMVNSINLSLECRVKGRHSVQGVVQYYEDRKQSVNFISGKDDQNYMNGYSIGIEYRFYTNPDKKSLRGFYVSPYYRYFFRDIEYVPGSITSDASTGPYSNVFFKRNIISYGFMVGIQDISRRFVGIDVFVGIGSRKKTDYDFKYEIEPYYEIQHFMDDGGEIRLGVNLILSNA